MVRLSWRARCRVASMPRSCRIRIAWLSMGRPTSAPRPALLTRTLSRWDSFCRNRSSAVGLRQILPMQTTSTCLDTYKYSRLFYDEKQSRLSSGFAIDGAVEDKHHLPLERCAHITVSGLYAFVRQTY